VGATERAGSGSAEAAVQAVVTPQREPATAWTISAETGEWRSQWVASFEFQTGLGGIPVYMRMETSLGSPEDRFGHT
jgi:hypothetical protein